MKQRYIVVDVAKCFDCNNCFMSCKDENVGNDWLPYAYAQPLHGHRWMNIQRHERGQYPRVDVAYLPMPCQQCQDAPCMKANPDCIEKKEDGVIWIDPAKAKGKKAMVDDCPYGAIYWNEEADVPQKCSMCIHLQDSWDMPRCVHSCPSGTLSYFTLEKEEMDKKVAEEGLEHYKAELNTNPNVYYKNLYRFCKLFIAGGVVKDGDCVEDAEVLLKESGETVKTNAYGDFKFDGLDPGKYTIVAGGKELEVTIEESVNLGTIEI